MGRQVLEDSFRAHIFQNLSLLFYSRNSPVNIVTVLLAGQLMNTSIPDRGKKFFFSQSVQTSFGAHQPASCSTSSRSTCETIPGITGACSTTSLFWHQSSRCVSFIHIKQMFKSNTTIYYTNVCSRQHVSTLTSHHQAIQRTNPRYIIYLSAFWDPWAVSIILCNKLVVFDWNISLVWSIRVILKLVKKIIIITIIYSTLLSQSLKMASSKRKHVAIFCCWYYNVVLRLKTLLLLISGNTRLGCLTQKLT